MWCWAYFWRFMSRREALQEYSYSVLSKSSEALFIFNKLMSSNEHNQVQFLLDCSVLPEVIHASQKDSKILSLLFKVTRTWCYSMHRARLKMLDRWCIWIISMTIQFEHYKRWFWVKYIDIYYGRQVYLSWAINFVYKLLCIIVVHKIPCINCYVITDMYKCCL